MAPAVAAALIAGGSSLLGGLLSNSANSGLNKETRRWQSEENALQRNWQEGQNGLDRSQESYWNQRSMDWQEKMWNLQNQYNSPSAMMARYREAGLNPYLAATVGQGAGAAPAGSAGSPSINSAPAGSPSGMGSAPSPIPMQNPLGSAVDVSLRALGVSAEIANQNARTKQQEWETYQYIRQHVGTDAAKKYLDNNPDMFQSSDPDNDPWMRSYKRAEVRETIQNENADFEFALRQLYGVKQAELELLKLKNESDDLVSLINKRDVEISEIKASTKKILEQIKTEKTIQKKNLSDASLSSAKAQTENESRAYIVRQLLLNTNVLEFTEQSERSNFESEESLRGWLTSDEGKRVKAEYARNYGVRKADAVWSAVMQLLGGFNVGIHN